MVEVSVFFPYTYFVRYQNLPTWEDLDTPNVRPLGFSAADFTIA
jgi:hypothetical protein